MKQKILTALLAFFTTSFVLCADTPDDSEFDRLERKASLFFSNAEWRNANAMYVLMLEQRPDDRAVYSRAIVSNIMAGDTARALKLIPLAMSNLIPIDTVLTEVQQTSFSIGRGELYEHFLLKTRETYPWYSRVVNNYLLAYYDFRSNGPELVRYASMMLEGLPSDLRLLRLLARGQMLSGRTDSAVKTWNRIIDLYPDNYDTLLDLANFYAVSDDPDTALTWFRRADAIRSTPYVSAYIARHSPTPAKH
ncbi:MAG: hypothetical protein K2K84_06415 [Muribaculaceae bacterium]|nr:hypothetical protein [Muribaculaceae bacterium]